MYAKECCAGDRPLLWDSRLGGCVSASFRRLIRNKAVACASSKTALSHMILLGVLSSKMDSVNKATMSLLIWLCILTINHGATDYDPEVSFIPHP